MDEPTVHQLVSEPGSTEPSSKKFPGQTSSTFNHQRREEVLRATTIRSDKVDGSPIEVPPAKKLTVALPFEIHEPPDAEISVTGLTGVYNAAIIRLDATIHKEPMAALADRSSTHNFIKIDIVKCLGLQAKPISPFKAKVRTGKILVCDRFYKADPIDIQGVQFDVDLYELLDCGTEVVLGVQWFRQLRYAWIYWDKSIVSFMNEEVEVKLEGSPMKRVMDFGRAHREQDGWNHQGNSVKTTPPATMAAKEDLNREAVADEKLAPAPPPATIAEEDAAFSCRKPEVPASLSFASHGLVDAAPHIKDVTVIRLEGGRRFPRRKNEETEVGGVKGFVHVPEPNWKRRKRTITIFVVDNKCESFFFIDPG
ncbi:unnamed protein product [Linum trigynum]|uniref:Reverse transcriptase domain-containing protein n=1 Tax=Linum trigynum TaxID=586398 RepID=A0AAV2E631_9ROSI